MHWEDLPKGKQHNADAIREMEKEENRRIGKFMRRIMWIVIPLVLILAVWLLIR